MAIRYESTKPVLVRRATKVVDVVDRGKTELVRKGPRKLGGDITKSPGGKVISPPAKDRGNPGTFVRLGDELEARVDRWAKAQRDKPSRPEAIRRLVDQAL